MMDVRTCTASALQIWDLATVMMYTYSNFSLTSHTFDALETVYGPNAHGA